MIKKIQQLFQYLFSFFCDGIIYFGLIIDTLIIDCNIYQTLSLIKAGRQVE